MGKDKKGKQPPSKGRTISNIIAKEGLRARPMVLSNKKLPQVLPAQSQNKKPAIGLSVVPKGGFGPKNGLLGKVVKAPT